MRLIDADAFTDKMRDLYRYAGWANKELHFSLNDLFMNIDGEPTVDAVPVEFIQQRIAQLNDVIEYEFNELGEYDGWALHAQSALEQLLQAWVAERKEE